MGDKNIFISFVGECILNPKYHGYVAGRIEVLRPDEIYASEEIRYFTKEVDEFYAFEDCWDMKSISEEELNYIKKEVETRFYDFKEE